MTRLEKFSKAVILGDVVRKGGEKKEIIVLFGIPVSQFNRPEDTMQSFLTCTQNSQNVNCCIKIEDKKNYFQDQ